MQIEQRLQTLIQEKLEAEANVIADAMISEYTQRLKRRATEMASSAAVEIFRQMSMTKLGDEMVITIRLPEQFQGENRG
jgi:hypothetical protein